MDNFRIMTVETVPGLWRGRDAIFRGPEIDLKTVEQIDSAGIAFLIQWSKSLAPRRLRLKNVPEAAIKLIDTFALRQLFEIQT